MQVLIIFCFPENSNLVVDRIFSFLNKPLDSAKSENNELINVAKLDQDEIKSLLDRAMGSIENGEYESSLNLLIEILSIDPFHQKANSVAGALLLSLQQFDSAEQLLYNAVRVSNWTDTNAIVNLANSLLYKGDPQLALKTLVKGYNTANITDSAMFNLVLADVYFNLSDFTKASEWYFSAAALLKTDERVWLQASTLFFPPASQNFKVAESVLVQAVQENRQNPKLLYYLGFVMYSTNRFSEAITFFKESIRLDKDYIDAVAGIAAAYHSSGDLKSAFEYYNSATSMKSDDPVVLANFAILLNEMGRKEDSIKVATLAYKANSTDKNVLKMMQILNLTVKH